ERFDMLRLLDGGAVASRKHTPGSGTEPVPEARANLGTGTDDDWFYQCAIGVFGAKETGQLLHLATGWPRASCYAFVARDAAQRRKPNHEFLRVLFRSHHGKPFFIAFMHGCEAQWWLDLQAEQDRAARIVGH